MTEVVACHQQGLDSHGNPREGAPQGDLPDFDPPPDLDLLRGRQQGDLADLLEVEPDGVFTLCQGRTVRVFGGYPRNLLRFVVDKDRSLPLACRCQASRSRRIALSSIATLSECHRVTGFLRQSWSFRCWISVKSFTEPRHSPPQHRSRVIPPWPGVFLSSWRSPQPRPLRQASDRGSWLPIHGHRGSWAKPTTLL